MSCMRESSIFADYVAALCTHCPSGDKKAGEGIAKWGRTMPSHGETRCAMPPTWWGERWVRMDNSSAGTMHKHGRRMRARDCSKVVTRCCAMRTQNGESRPNSNALGCEWLDLSKISKRQTWLKTATQNWFQISHCNGAIIPLAFDVEIITTSERTLITASFSSSSPHRFVFKFLGLCSDILGHKQAESAHQLFWSHQLFWFVRFALNDSVFFCWHEYKGRPIHAIKSLSTGRLGERDSTFSLRSKPLNDFPFSLLRFLPYAVWVLVSGVTCAMADLFSGVRILSWFLNMYKRFRRTSVNQCSNWKYLFPLYRPSAAMPISAKGTVVGDFGWVGCGRLWSLLIYH